MNDKFRKSLENGYGFLNEFNKYWHKCELPYSPKNLYLALQNYISQ